MAVWTQIDLDWRMGGGEAARPLPLVKRGGGGDEDRAGDNGMVSLSQRMLETHVPLEGRNINSARCHRVPRWGPARDPWKSFALSATWPPCEL